ncbi:MAG: lysozyme, partial [Muribaculaceae bacterium]|nr:lysozyme [Muribaculaceae bacterium]
MGLKTGQAGLDLIKKFEGCRLTAYKCPAGIWTIGYGHTGGVQTGQTITQAQADDLLKKDLAKFEANVNKYSKYGWRQNEFDALVSFA